MHAVDQLMGTDKHRRREIHNLFQQRKTNPTAATTSTTKTTKERGRAGTRVAGGIHNFF
jgi:hypothetical protein